MKHLIFTLISFLLFLPLQNVAQNECPAAAKRMLKEAASFRKAKNYEKAIDKCNAARNCDPALASNADALIVEIFKDIEGEKKAAIEQKKRANEQERIAKENERIAKLAKDTAEIRKLQAEEQTQIARLAKDTAEIRKLQAEEQTRIARLAKDTAEIRRQEAEAQTKKAQSLALTAAANSAFYKDENATKSFRYAQYALQMDSNNYEAQAALLQSIYQPHNKPLIPFYFALKDTTNNNFNDVEISLDRTKLFTLKSVWDIETGNLVAEINSNSTKAVDSTEEVDYHAINESEVNKKNEALKRKLKGSEECIKFFFSTDGKVICGGFSKGVIKVWDAKTGKIMHVLETLSDSDKPSGEAVADEVGDIDDIEKEVDIIFSKDSAKLFAKIPIISVPVRYAAQIWDYQQGERFADFSLSSDIFIADTLIGGKLICTSHDDNTTKIWDFQTGEQLAILKGGVKDIKFAPNNKVISLFDDPAINFTTIKIWDLDKIKLASKSFCDSSSHWESGFFANNQNIYIHKSNGTWAFDANMDTTEMLNLFPNFWVDTPTRMSEGGKYLYTHVNDTISIWDRETKQFDKFKVPFKPDQIKHLFFFEKKYFSHDSSDSRPFYVYNIDKDKQIVFLLEIEDIYNAVFSHADSSIYFLTNKGDIKIWKNNTITFHSNINIIHEKEGMEVKNALFSHSIDKIVILEKASSNEGEKMRMIIQIWDIAKKKAIERFLFERFDSEDKLCISPNSKLIAFESDNGVITVVSAETGITLLNLYIGEEQTTSSINFSSDSKQIIVSVEEGITKTWIIDTSTLIEKYNDQVDDLTPEEKAKYNIK